MWGSPGAGGSGPDTRAPSRTYCECRVFLRSIGISFVSKTLAREPEVPRTGLWCPSTV